MTMTQTCPVTAIAWSPTRSGLLATLGKESPVVQLYDIQHTSVGKYDTYSQVDVLTVTKIMCNIYTLQTLNFFIVYCFRKPLAKSCTSI